jgi:hypothetical protein
MLNTNSGLSAEQSYLRTTGLPIGLLMNFNSTLLKNGLQRITPVGPREARLK